MKSPWDGFLPIKEQIKIKRELAKIWRADLIGSSTFNRSKRSQSNRLLALLAIEGGADQIA
uniref:Uncharacterized protein n=1 Tax=Timema bartmani TaxID=61472 RepID=A0A7R9FB18_9NEOP|nr:unnamed protein product [Timema bartmani]